MELMHLYERKTHKYVDECRDMDEHEYLGRVKITPPQRTVEPKDFDDGGTYVRFARLPVGADKRRYMAALAENLSNWGCTHEYDCCGCMLVRASVTPTARDRTVRVEMSVVYNYY
jgi:hypothetical protein